MKRLSDGFFIVVVVLVTIVGFFILGLKGLFMKFKAGVKIRADKFRFMTFLLSIALAIGGLFLIAELWEAEGLGSLFDDNIPLIQQIKIAPGFVVLYYLFSFIPLCFSAWKKNGFSNLNSIGRDGLLGSLATGQVVGQVVGLILWLVGGGLIAGQVVGLVGGLIAGLIAGLLGEFSPSVDKVASS